MSWGIPAFLVKALERFEGALRIQNNMEHFTLSDLVREMEHAHEYIHQYEQQERKKE